MNLLSFDPFSLDVFYYPVSWIMWVWYKLFAAVLGPSNFFAWALSVMFLVFSLRALLYKPFVRQIRTTRQMQELQPQIKALQKKYGKDRQRMALEMQKLQREHGFNPILGCLPMLAQIPVFLGLYHVLRSFNRTTGGIGQPHMSVIQNRLTGNYVFTADRRRPLPGRKPVGRADRRVHDATCRVGRVHPLQPSRGDRCGCAGDDHGRHCDLLQQSRVGGAAECGSGRQSPDGNDEQARVVRVPARRRRRWTVPAAGDHLVLVLEQHLDLRSAALRVRHDRKRGRGQEARSDPAPGGERAGAGRQAKAPSQGGTDATAKVRRQIRVPPSQVTEAETTETEANKPTVARNNAPTNRTPRPGARPKKRKR